MAESQRVFGDGTVTTGGSLGQYEQEICLFVYGTLCVPAVLVRVLGRPCDHLKFQDALLPGYTRHCVKGEDYPAIINTQDTNMVLPTHTDSSAQGNNTRGTLVSGLTYADIRALDIFEGSEYARRKVTVQTLTRPTTFHDLPTALLDPETRQPLETAETEEPVQPQGGGSPEEGKDRLKGEKECWAYIWSAPLDRLEPKIWNFHDFMRDKAKYWVSADTTEYDEVDQHRALQGAV